MSRLQDAPIYDPPVEDNDGKMRLSWILFFQQLAQGDVGTSWVPVATNLANTGGAPTIIGSYFQNQGWTDFFIYIQPKTDTSSVAGSTYFNLPFTVSVNTNCSVSTGVSSSSGGGIDFSTRRCYPPTWTNITTPLTITGRVKS